MLNHLKSSSDDVYNAFITNFLFAFFLVSFLQYILQHYPHNLQYPDLQESKVGLKNIY